MRFSVNLYIVPFSYAFHASRSFAKRISCHSSCRLSRPSLNSAKRISEPWHPLRCIIPRFCNCFSAAKPTKHLCDRLRGGSCVISVVLPAAKRISGLRHGLRCQLCMVFGSFSAAKPTWRCLDPLRYQKAGIEGWREFRLRPRERFLTKKNRKRIPAVPV